MIYKSYKVLKSFQSYLLHKILLWQGSWLLQELVSISLTYLIIPGRYFKQVSLNWQHDFENISNTFELVTKSSTTCHLIKP